MKTIKEGLYLFPNLSRAYEVALSSNLLIKPFRNEDYPEDAVLDDLKITGIIDMFSNSGDIQCLIDRPSFQDILSTRDHITKEDIKKRTDSIAGKPLPTEFERITSVKLLLKTAWERLDLTLHDYNVIMLMSASIARLEGSAAIKTEHVAEAIHYRSIQGRTSNDAIPVNL